MKGADTIAPVVLIVVHTAVPVTLTAVLMIAQPERLRISNNAVVIRMNAIATPFKD